MRVIDFWIDTTKPIGVIELRNNIPILITRESISISSFDDVTSYLGTAITHDIAFSRNINKEIDQYLKNYEYNITIHVSTLCRMNMHNRIRQETYDHMLRGNENLWESGPMVDDNILWMSNIHSKLFDREYYSDYKQREIEFTRTDY